MDNKEGGTYGRTLIIPPSLWRSISSLIIASTSILTLRRWTAVLTLWRSIGLLWVLRCVVVVTLSRHFRSLARQGGAADEGSGDDGWMDGCG